MVSVEEELMLKAFECVMQTRRRCFLLRMMVSERAWQSVGLASEKGLLLEVEGQQPPMWKKAIGANH